MSRVEDREGFKVDETAMESEGGERVTKRPYIVNYSRQFLPISNALNSTGSGYSRCYNMQSKMKQNH